MRTNSVKLHRVIRTTPEKLYRAFVDPDALAKWLPPNGFTAKVHQMEAKVGGTFRMSFTNFTTTHSHAFGGTYNELVPGKRIRYTERFENPALAGEMVTTVELTKATVGTEIHVVQEGIPEVIPPDACMLGWHESLTALAQLVEPNIPD